MAEPTKEATEHSRYVPGDGTNDSPDTLRESSSAAELTREEPVSSTLLFGEGRRLGRYLLLEELGRGGMGIVHAAFDQELGRKIAIKLVRQPFKRAVDHDQARLQQEAQAMAMVTHPNIVTVYDVGRSGDDVFVAMEYVPGWTLREWQKQEHRWWRILRTYVDAGEGLGAAHAQGLVHRDFKPDNVLIGRDGRVKVADFGLARVERPETASLRPKEPEAQAAASRLGTPAYMSPEQHLGRVASTESDQFSFCVALWEALFGHHPYSPEEGTSLTMAVCRGRRTARPRGTAVPSGVVEALDRGLSFKPEERHADMRALLDRLKGAVDSHFGRSSLAPHSTEVAAPERSTLASRYRLEPESARFGLESAFDKATRRFVTVYCPLDAAGPAAAPAGEAVALFRALGRLDHPNLVGLRDLGFDETRGPFLVYDLPSNAERLIDVKRKASFDSQLAYLVEVLRAIAFLHDVGLADLSFSIEETYVVGDRLKLLLKKPPTRLSEGSQLERATRRAKTRDLSRFARLAHALLLDSADSQAETLSWSDTELEPEISGLFRELAAGSTRDTDVRLLAGRILKAGGRRIEFDTAETREALLRSVALVGRTEQLERLLDGLRLAIDGRGSLQSVTGESGSGKTRLLDLLEIQAAASGSLVVRGQCEAEGAIAYQAFQAPLRLLSLQTEPTAFEASVLSWVVPDLGGLLGRDVARAPELDADSMLRRLCDVVEALLLRSSRPTLMLIEDAQWARPESLALLGRLGQRLPHLRAMVCISLRSDVQAETKSSLFELPQVRVGSLSADEVVTLVRRLPIPAEDTDAVSSYVYHHSEGNALFAIEVLRNLAEQSGGFSEIRTDRLPSLLRVGGLMRGLRKRLLKLPEETWPVLRLAAVAGRRIDEGFLARLDGLEAVGRFVRAAKAAGIIDNRSGDLRFSHDKLREAVLEETTEGERRGLHERLGRTIESLPDAQESHNLLRLAHHFAEARDLRSEALYSGRAGLMLTHSSPAEAARLLQRAVALAPEHAPTDLETWRRALGEAEFDLGHLDRALTQLEVVCHGLGRPVPNSRWGWTWRLLKEVTIQAGHLLGPSAFVRTHRAGKQRDLALALDKLSEVYTYQGRRLETMTTCLSALNAGDRVGFLPLGALGILGYTAVVLGFRRVARRYFDRGRLSLRDDPQLFHPYFYLTEAFADFAIGKVEACRKRLLEGYDLAKSLGHSRGAAQCLSALGLAEWASGRFADMLTRYEVILDQREFVPEHDTANLSAASTALALLGRRTEALKAFQRVEQTVEKTPATMRRAIDAGRAYTLALCDEPVRACELADAAMDGISPEALESILIITLWGPLEAYLPVWEQARQHDPARAAMLRVKVKRQVDLFRRYARMIPVARGFAQLAQARFLRIDGHGPAAARLIKKSLRLLQLAGQLYAEGIAQRELGLLEPAGSKERALALQKAASLFEQCDAAVDLEQTRALGLPAQVRR